DAAALSAVVPMMTSYALNVRTDVSNRPAVTVEGGPYVNAVTPRYFDVLGTRFFQGRAVAGNDDDTAKRGAIVHGATAVIWWPGSEALGHCVYLVTGACSRVIGIVEDTRRRSIFEEPSVQVFVPLAQAPAPLGAGALVIRPTASEIAGEQSARVALVRSLEHI